MLVSLEDQVAGEDERRRRSSFSELLLRHLVTGKCCGVGYTVLGAKKRGGIKTSINIYVYYVGVFQITI